MSNEDGQVEHNYRVFEGLLPKLLQSRPGQFALMHDGQIVDYYESAVLAVIAGASRFGHSQYSVQEITGQAEDLGFYSYAGGSLQA